MNNNQWVFTDANGTFRWSNPSAINELYFPLCNESGLMSAITPVLHGDIKKSQQNFLLLPTSVEDLHNSKAARNFWIYVEGVGPWSVSGNSAAQHTRRFDKNAGTDRSVEAGFLYHKAIYTDNVYGLKSEVLNFVPNNDMVEIMHVKVTNISDKAMEITPTSAIPIYGRSAENIRDHRHVTSLVNRPKRISEGVTMQPVILFDETGHKWNKVMYFVLGSDQNGNKPVGSIVSIPSFVGQAGDLEWPEAVVSNLSPHLFNDEVLDGKECIGGLRFEKKTLEAGASVEYILLMGIGTEGDDLGAIYNKYNTSDKVMAALEENKTYWLKNANKVVFNSGLPGFTNWMKWVEVQPVFRKIFGCSFLPYHDYGKGGRGWRDLWQDCLSLILLQPEQVKELLINNFGGVRVDGTNATIIGTLPGEFIADRNNISRVWMDHGSWPYLTTKLYIDQSGDLDILLEKQTYFRDRQIRRAFSRDENWTTSYGKQLKTASGDVYEGTIIEHILIQNLSCFFNVGEHNIIKLEGADWNDTLDMARTRGESTAFTAFYGSNLISIAKLLRDLKAAKGIDTIEVFEEMTALFDTLKGSENYDSISYKTDLLNHYYDLVSDHIQGKKTLVSIEALANDLEAKGQWIFEHIRKNEYIVTAEGDGFFNGYYNEDGERVDGPQEDGVHMYLTGQVFTTMFGLATDEQVLAAYQSCQKYLKDQKTGGYKLNTPLGKNTLNFGRGFSFSYGDKENGATFSHMVVMYMNALYQRGFIKEAYEVFDSMYQLCMDTEHSKIYPGIPEYFNLDGKGMYHYLTGSASWLFLTALTEMFGVKGHLGDLMLQPKLVVEQFDEKGVAGITTTFADRRLNIEFINAHQLDVSAYAINKVTINGVPQDASIKDAKTVVIPRNVLSALNKDDVHTIQVYMG